jgi:hypothetical protein
MRSNLGGHFAGFGTSLAMPIVEDDGYVDKKVRNVRFTNEPIDNDYDELCARLSGVVHVYQMSQLSGDTNV